MVACYCLIDVEHRPGGQADSQHVAGQLMPIFTCKAREPDISGDL
jgi:hypothetical protein